MYTQYFEYVWKKRRYVHMEWIFCFRKGNKRSTNKIEKRILPSQVQRLEKTREVQKNLQSFCDKEDDDSSEKVFVSARSMQKVDNKNRTNHDTSSIQRKKILEVDLTDSSSSENVSSISENSFISYKKSKLNKSKRDQKTKSIRDSTQKVSKSAVKEKNISKKSKISSDSDDDSSDMSSNKTIAEKRTIKHNVRTEKTMKPKINRNPIYSSDSESDENDTNRISSVSKNVSKRISKDTRQQNKKIENSYNAKMKDNAKKNHDSTSESEDEEHKKQSGKKHLETSRMTSHSSNDERKHHKSNKRLSNIQEDDSDNSSSKEFQKIKLQKVNRNKYSTRKLVDLEIDYTKSPHVKISLDNKSEKDINEQSNQNLKDIKNILSDCKKICSNFQMYIETIEQLYGKKDEEQLVLKSTEKIDRLKTMLEDKQKNLTAFCQLWSRNREKSVMKRSHKVVSDDEQSSEDRKKCTASEDKHISGDKQDGDKAVSECDSEEIFSANESRSSQKLEATPRKVDTLSKENSLHNNETNTNDKDRMSLDELKNNDKNNTDMQDDLVTSPVLGTLKEKKISTERLSKKQVFSECNKSNDETQLTDENTNKQVSLNTDRNEIEDSPLRNNSKNVTLGNDGRSRSNERNIINESMDDMFDTSPQDAEENSMEIEMDVETNRDKDELLHTTKDKILDTCESSLQDKNEVPSEKERPALPSCNTGDDQDLTDQVDQEKMISIAAIAEELHDDDPKATRRSNTDNESFYDDEAKKALLATDSDTLDTLSDENVAKSTEELINDTNQTKKKNETEDNDSDVSTVILDSFIKEVNINVEKDTTIEREDKTEKKSDNKLDKRSCQEMSDEDEDEDVKADKAAKKVLLESNSDDSVILSSESGKLTDKTSESDSSEKNAKAKLLLLASSSENSGSEAVLSETTNVSKSTDNTKRNREVESDEESMISRLKKRKLNLEKNHYYKNDKKLRMSCKVYLTRLSREVLKCHSRALRKSREYLEHKALKRYREFSLKPMSIVLHRLT